MRLRAFTVDVPQEKIEAIRARLAASRITYAPADDQAWRYGADARYLAEFRDHWLERYDWRAQEARLNAFPQFKAEVDGQEVHFYHVPGDGPSPFPLILTHGWPGSVVEFLEVMPRLARAGYDVVVPSLPGYGFSARPASPIGVRRVADLWRRLMCEVLGYRRFGAQGGDWGAAVTLALGREHADVVAAIHLNLIFQLGMDPPSPAFLAWRRRMDEIIAQESAYMFLHRTRPQTIALALADTPLGFAAWVLEKCRAWADTRGDLERSFSKDELITNIMTYLVNDAVASSIWLYNGASRETPSLQRVTAPLGFASFPGEFTPPPPREVVEQLFDLKRWSEMSAGGHFAAWEEPEAFSAEVAAYFRTWR